MSDRLQPRWTHDGLERLFRDNGESMAQLTNLLFVEAVA
jgi:hypothetical protein